jgi:predicted GH43/DUF377 family glycosyl hydrolase
MRKPLKTTWQHCSLVQNEVFVEGINRKRSHLLFYYGGVDKSVGVAES